MLTKLYASHTQGHDTVALRKDTTNEATVSGPQNSNTDAQAVTGTGCLEEDMWCGQCHDSAKAQTAHYAFLSLLLKGVGSSASIH